MQLILTKEEKQILEELLISEIKEIKDEIHHTDDHDYKEELKNKEKVLEELLSKIQILD